MDTTLRTLAIILLLVFHMATLNFNRILLKLADQGSIPQDTLQSQDGLNLGDIHFCPILQTLCMQRISLDCLWGLVAKVHSCPPCQRAPLSSAGLQPFSSSSRQMTNMRRSLTSMCDTLKVGGEPGKRHAFCLFINNYGGAMSVPIDPSSIP